jgi:hypothetical protein
VTGSVRFGGEGNIMLDTLGNVLGDIVRWTGDATTIVLLAVLAAMVVAVPLYTVYAVVSSLRAPRSSGPVA